MAFAALALEQAVVGDLVQHLVLEGVFAHAVERGVLGAAPPARAAPARAARPAACASMRGQRLVPEHEADHRGLLQRQLLGRRQAVQPRLQHAGQRRRHVRGQQLVGRPRVQRSPPVTIAPSSISILHQLFHVERVAFGAAGDQLAQRGGHRRRRRCSSSSASSRLARLSSGCRSMRWWARLGRAQSGGARTASAASGRAPASARRGCTCAQVVDEVERAVVGPVQVVEQQHDGGAALRRGHGGSTCAAAWKARLRICRASSTDAPDVRAVGEVQADQVAQQMGMRLGLGPSSARTAAPGRASSLRLARCLRRRSSAICSRQASRSRSRPIGLACVCGWARPWNRQNVLGPRLGPVLELVEQPALADAGLADHRDRGIAARHDRRWKASCSCSSSASRADHAGLDAFDAARGDAEGARLGALHQVGGERLVDALDLHRRLRLDVEHAAHMAHRCRG